MSERSESIKELATALAKAQGELRAAEMTATNPFLKNKYADLGSIIKAAQAPLANNGLAIVQPVSDNGDIVTVETLLMHQSGEWISERISSPATKENGISAVQSMGKIITYLRRYSYASMLGVYGEEDTDGNDDPKPEKKQPAAEKKQPEQPIPPAPKANGKPAEQPQPAAPDLAWDQAAVLKLAKEYNQPTNRIDNVLAYCTLPKPSNYDTLTAWMKLYRAERDADKHTVPEAAEIANKAMMQPA